MVTVGDDVGDDADVEHLHPPGPPAPQSSAAVPQTGTETPSRPPSTPEGGGGLQSAGLWLQHLCPPVSATGEQQSSKNTVFDAQAVSRVHRDETKEIDS